MLGIYVLDKRLLRYICMYCIYIGTYLPPQTSASRSLVFCQSDDTQALTDTHISFFSTKYNTSHPPLAPAPTMAEENDINGSIAWDESHLGSPINGYCRNDHPQCNGSVRGPRAGTLGAHYETVTALFFYQDYLSLRIFFF